MPEGKEVLKESHRKATKESIRALNKQRPLITFHSDGIYMSRSVPSTKAPGSSGLLQPWLRSHRQSWLKSRWGTKPAGKEVGGTGDGQ